MINKQSNLGFTLVELMVVVGIIALLVGILLPALSQSRAAAKTTMCGSNLRQIAFAVRCYTNDYNDILHMAPDRWQWTTTTAPIKLISNVSANAYWGVAYLPYLAPRTIFSVNGDAGPVILDAARRVFNCPAELVMSPANGNVDPTTPGHYGVNFCICGKYSSRWQRLSRLRHPSETIFCQDAFEQRLEGNIACNPDEAGDMLSAFGGTSNLQEWRPGGVGAENYVPGSTAPLREYYRHGKQSQVLWVDGHVSLIAKSDGRDVPADWYWGQSARPVNP
ncbi:MAG: hypothetical protein JWM57_176 [Phycisphaerales bacterium]|nr:hypothetical protein [Phycisphaerales bacterium]